MRPREPCGVQEWMDIAHSTSPSELCVLWSGVERQARYRLALGNPYCRQEVEGDRGLVYASGDIVKCCGLHLSGGVCRWSLSE